MASQFERVPSSGPPRENECVPCDLGHLHKLFCDDKRWDRNVTPNTIIWHQRAFRAYQLAGCIGLPSEAMVRRFKIETQKRGVKPVSVNTWLRSLGVFARWLVREGHLASMPMIEPLEAGETLIRIFTDDQVRALLHAQTTPRMKLLIALLFDTGLRISEALTLKWLAVDYDACMLTVIGKGRKERLVAFSYTLRSDLRAYQKRYSRMPLIGSVDWVFATRRGTPWTRDNARRLFHSVLRQHNIPLCGFHRIRHTFATNFIRQGGGGNGDARRELQTILRHSTSLMTDRYVHLANEDIKHAQQRTSLVTRLGR